MTERVACPENCATCYHCRAVCLADAVITVNGNTYCPTCQESYLAVCTCCEEYYNPSNLHSWGGMCPSCAEEHFVCDNCSGTFHTDDYGEDGLCETCARHHSPDLRDAHDNPDIVFHPDESETLYFGVELETDDYDDVSEAANALKNLDPYERLFFLQEDGSLRNGIEIASQPCTLDFHRDIFPWQKIVEIVNEQGGKSHQTSTCGLHIHFSRAFFNGGASDLYQVRLIYLFERFWDKLIQFSRREGHSWETYAARYNESLYDRPAKAKMYQLKRKNWKYMAVNITNRDTIEIRLFRGTLKVETLLASIELVDFLVRLVKKASTRELQRISWGELVKRALARNYLYLPCALAERNLLEE